MFNDCRSTTSEVQEEQSLERRFEINLNLKSGKKNFKKKTERWTFIKRHNNESNTQGKSSRYDWAGFTINNNPDKHYSISWPSSLVAHTFEEKHSNKFNAFRCAIDRLRFQASHCAIDHFQATSHHHNHYNITQRLADTDAH